MSKPSCHYLISPFPEISGKNILTIATNIDVIILVDIMIIINNTNNNKIKTNLSKNQERG